MIDSPDIFEPLSIPWGFNGGRAERLEYQARERGVVLQCRWADRRNLVTSQIQFLNQALAGPVEMDLENLILRLGPAPKRGFYMEAMKDFSARAAQQLRGTDPYWERVVGPFGRVHIVPRQSTTAICGQTGVCYDTTMSASTCQKCLRLISERQDGATDSGRGDFELHPEERALLAIKASAAKRATGAAAQVNPGLALSMSLVKRLSND